MQNEFTTYTCRGSDYKSKSLGLSHSIDAIEKELFFLNNNDEEGFRGERDH